MKKTLWILIYAVGICGAQTGGGSHPASTNVRGSEYPRIHSDLRVTFQVKAPTAQKVQVVPPEAGGAPSGLGKTPYDMVKDKDGVWTVTTPPVVPGFHYYWLLIDGVPVSDPASDTFYGFNKPTSGIDVPEPGVDFYDAKEVPHGDVRAHWYFSKITGQWRRAHVYTPVLCIVMSAPVIICTTLFAQEPPTVSPGTRGGQAQAATIRSPELLADNRVTFRLFAPKATEVLVQGNWQGGRGLAMTKDDSGVWSVTTSALQPELWGYTFSVDGVRTLDPRNYNVARDGVGFMNTVLVPGEGSAVFQPQQVPHGTVTTMWVPSTLMKTPRRVFVYTPAGYEESTAKYPVLYLLHGSGGDEDAWPTMGIANVITDQVFRIAFGDSMTDIHSVEKKGCATFWGFK